MSRAEWLTAINHDCDVDGCEDSKIRGFYHGLAPDVLGDIRRRMSAGLISKAAARKM